MTAKAARWRERAKELRDTAEKTHDPATIRAALKLATDIEAFAARLDSREPD